MAVKHYIADSLSGETARVAEENGLKTFSESNDTEGILVIRLGYNSNDELIRIRREFNERYFEKTIEDDGYTGNDTVARWKTFNKWLKCSHCP